MLLLYTDGGCIRKNPSPFGLSYAFRLITNQNIIICEGSGVNADYVPCENNMAEMLAAIIGLENTPSLPVTLLSDSGVTIGRMRDGWKMNGIPEPWCDRLSLSLLRLNGLISFKLLDGHPTRDQLQSKIGKRGNPCSEHNVFCDKRCGVESRKYLKSIGYE